MYDTYIPNQKFNSNRILVLRDIIKIKKDHSHKRNTENEVSEKSSPDTRFSQYVGWWGALNR